jgi:hypothetical protein
MFQVLVPTWATWWLCKFHLVTSAVCFPICTMGLMTGKMETMEVS